jgi:uncharacterized protein YecA (UPF0149 family)
MLQPKESRSMNQESRTQNQEGTVMTKRGAVKIHEVVSGAKTPGRNDPCPCGSGRKYKKCCYPKFG